MPANGGGCGCVTGLLIIALFFLTVNLGCLFGIPGLLVVLILALVVGAVRGLNL